MVQEDQPWTAVGEYVKQRREAIPLRRREADRASGVKEPTWRRLEGGRGVEAGNLYKMLAALHLSETEARAVFERVGFDFDAASYEMPPAIAELRRHLGSIKRSAEAAEVAAARLEHELRTR